MTQKRLLIISSSPRKGGKIMQMVEIAVHDALAKGWHVDTIDVYEKNIAYCQGCMKCKETTVCVIKDDVQNIIELMKACDLVIVASPVYFANIPGPLKNLFDRMVGALMDDNHSAIPKGRFSKQQFYVLMCACTTPFPFSILGRQSTGALRAMKVVLHISGMRKAGSITLNNTKNMATLPASIEKKIKRYV